MTRWSAVLCAVLLMISLFAVPVFADETTAAATTAAATTAAKKDDAAKEEKKGCGSTVGLGVFGIMAFGAAACTVKRKRK